MSIVFFLLIEYSDKEIIVSPDSTINDVLNEFDYTVSNLKQLGIIDDEINKHKHTL